MFLELIAAIMAGVAAAGVVLIVNKLTGGRLPKWLIPAAAGLAMIAFGTVMEMSWYDRTVGEFPEGVEVVATGEKASAFRPWTYIWPITNSLSAIDTSSIRSNEGVPDQRMAQVVLLGRWKASRVLPMIFDCVDGQVAPLVDTVKFDESGAVIEANWSSVGVEDPTLTFVCREDLG